MVLFMERRNRSSPAVFGLGCSCCLLTLDYFSRLPTTASRTHAAHVTITALSAMDGPRAGELYNALRTTYNRTRLPGAVPLPPLEEWKGISHLCKSCYCRYVRQRIPRAVLRSVSFVCCVD